MNSVVILLTGIVKGEYVLQWLFFIMPDDYFVDRFTKEHFSFKLTLFIYSSYANNISFTCKGYVQLILNLSVFILQNITVSRVKKDRACYISPLPPDLPRPNVLSKGLKKVLVISLNIYLANIFSKPFALRKKKCEHF